MFAADYRTVARKSLSGNWLIAIAAFLIAGLLGGASGSPIHLTAPSRETQSALEIFFLSIPFDYWLLRFPPVTLFLLFIHGVVSSVIEPGYAAFNLELVDGKPPQLYTLLDYISHIVTAFCTLLLRNLLIILGTMCFVIPGILMFYNYALTDYVLAENPNLSARQVLARSKELMYGNRWRLFCLQFSFIGWNILCAFTFGIGNLWLMPYQAAAKAAFYRDLTCGLSYHRKDIMDF